MKAAFARVETELKAKTLKPADAIETLEKLRYRWRGDDLELRTLRKLGSLYFAESRWREGLDVLRISSVNFPGSELVRDAQDDMRSAFNDLFLGGKTEAMPPVQALALFYDFIELTPIGRDGDEMIRRLTERLVAIDLLASAELLLDHQVYQRLDGVARSVVATQLAVIYLLDNKPKEALRSREHRRTALARGADAGHARRRGLFIGRRPSRASAPALALYSKDERQPRRQGLFRGDRENRPAGVAFQDLAKSIAAVDTLQAFMADLKKQGVAPAAAN